MSLEPFSDLCLEAAVRAIVNSSTFPLMDDTSTIHLEYPSSIPDGREQILCPNIAFTVVSRNDASFLLLVGATELRFAKTVVTGAAVLGAARSAHLAPHAPLPRAGGHRGHSGRGGGAGAGRGHLLVLPLAAALRLVQSGQWCLDQMDLTNNCLLTPCFTFLT